jgi:hypothetical protein
VPRKLYIWIGGAAVVGLLVVAGVTNGGTSSRERSIPTTSTETTEAPVPQGDAREPEHAAIATPDAGKLAGAPVPTARRFVSVWLNRRADAAELRRQRPILVGTSTGAFAQLTEVTMEDAIATGDYGPENEGTVEFAKQEPSGGKGAVVLVVCRERAGDSDFGITTYLVRVAQLGPDRYAVSALEPQG